MCAMSELVFTKDGITIKTQVSTPLVGETFHEEKLPYDKLPVDGIQITITSISPTFDGSGSLKALSFGVRDIASAPANSANKAAAEITLTRGSIRYNYLNLNPKIRRFFPGYKVPFMLTDDKKQYSVHVTSANAGTLAGDPDGGFQVVGGLKEFFGRHKSKPGDKLHVTVIEPGKSYRISTN